jgi:hypothetical protein
LWNARGAANCAKGRVMLREDYLIGWFQRYLRWLAEIAGFIRSADYEAALRRMDLALRELLDLGADSVGQLSDTDILARLTMDELPTVARDKCLLVAALLVELGRVAAAQGNPAAAREAWLKALHVALGTRLRGANEAWPEFAPKVEDLVALLRDQPLPPRTCASLLLHHAQRGAFAEAENALFDLLEITANDADALDIGDGFYQRLAALSEPALAAGGLSRAEVAEGRAELARRRGGAGA